MNKTCWQMLQKTLSKNLFPCNMNNIHNKMKTGQGSPTVSDPRGANSNHFPVSFLHWYNF